jgi:hypothetical protein
VEPGEVRQLLDVLIQAGVSRAKVPIRDGQVLEVEFAPVEMVGPAQSSEEDLPWNARDPDTAIAQANFNRKKA